MPAAGLLFLAFLVPAFTIGWNTWKIVSYYKKTRYFIKVPGMVTGIDVKTADDMGKAPYKYFAPIIKYTTLDNTTYRVIYSEDNPDRSLYKIGEPVTICYDPAEPIRFFIYDPKAEYLVAGVWIVIGLVVGFFICRAIFF